MIKIILADDHDVVRHGVRSLLEGESDLVIEGEANNGLEVQPLIEQVKPDLLIVDLMMPGLNGLEVLRRVAKSHPNIRIIVLSMHSEEAFILQALKNGASGYVLKDASVEFLVKAIREVMKGRKFLSPPISETALATFLKKIEEGILDPYDELTPREKEILQLTAEGNSSPQIAEILTISSRTVETHRNNLMKKMNFNHQADLIRLAIRKGIIPPEK